MVRSVMMGGLFSIPFFLFGLWFGLREIDKISHLNPPRIFLRAATFNPQKMMMMMSYSVFVHRAVFAPTT